MISGRAAAALLTLGATAVVYYPVTRTYFFADDFVCLLDIVDEGFVRFVLSVFGGHILLLRNLVFYLSHAAFGFDPAPYYWMLFLTHLANVWLLRRVLHALTDDLPVACLGAVAWGTSPLCVGVLGWYATYGHALVATILLVVLGEVVRRAPAGRVGPGRAGAWAALLLAGTTCFGVGIGLALVFPVALLLLAPATVRDRRALAIILGVAPAAVTLYFAYRRLSGLVEPLPLSEAVVVSLGVRQLEPIVSMLGHLMRFGTSGLVLGFFFSPEDYPGTASSVACAAALAAVVIVAATADGATRRWVLGLLVLSAGAYAIIAVGRANFYAATHLPPAASARQLRYHYAALVPLVIVLCLVLHRTRRALRIPGGALLAAWLAVAVYGYARSGWSIDRRDGFRWYTGRTLATIDATIMARPAGSVVSIPNHPVQPAILGPGLRPVDFPGWAALFVLRYPDNVVAGRRVVFVESDPAILFAVRSPDRHRRLHDLLVPAAPAG